MTQETTPASDPICVNATDRCHDGVTWPCVHCRQPAPAPASDRLAEWEKLANEYDARPTVATVIKLREAIPALIAMVRGANDRALEWKGRSIVDSNALRHAKARATAAEARVAVLEAEIDQLRIAGTILAQPLAKATDHARTSPGPVNCKIRARFQTSMALPRQCARCGLGPCPFFNDDGSALNSAAPRSL